MFKKKTLYIGIVFIFALVFIISYKHSGKITKKAGQPLDVALYFIQGPADESSYVSVGIFSKMLKQEKIDDQIKGRDGKSKTKKSDDKLYFKIDKSMWKDKILFWALDENGKKNKIKKGVKLISSPDEEKLFFTADSFYNAIYEIGSNSLPKQNGKIYADVTIGKDVIISNSVSIPEKTAGEYENLVRSAEITVFLGNYDKLTPIAEKIISIKNDSYLGYWYKGLALESEKDYKSALSAFETALKKYQQPSLKDFLREPPTRLAQKIEELKKK
jgi:tetratricopeptide (TPR) repeat protein